MTLVDDLPRRKRRTSSPKVPRLSTAAKRKIRAHVSPSITKPHKILQMLKYKGSENEGKDEESKTEVEAPQAINHPENPQDAVSDADTIVGEKDNGELCKEMKDFLARFANVALNERTPVQEHREEFDMQVDPDTRSYPESVSPPLQELSPTLEAVPVYTPKPSQRLLVNNILKRDKATDEVNPNFVGPTPTPEIPNINMPLNARRTPVLVENIIEEKKTPEVEKVVAETTTENCDSENPNAYKYVTFGIEIKKAMEECQNIINSYNVKEEKDVGTDDKGGTQKTEEKDLEREMQEVDGALSLEQICEVMMNLDKNSAEFLDKIEQDDSDEPVDVNFTNSKLVELVENMPQILANMPEIATKLSEFANASFELPEFASIMSNLPEVNNEAQLTPETLKQIRELKLNKTRDNVKVTKNTAKRKTIRKLRSSVENDIIGTMTFEIDSKDISDVIKDEKEIEAIVKNKSSSKEFKDLLFSISAQVVINKVFEYLKQNKNPDLAKCFEDDKELFSTNKNSFTSEMFTKASTLFDNSVKDALSMHDLRQIIKCRFTAWKHYVARKFKSIPREMLDKEIENMLDKFYNYIHDFAMKQTDEATDKVVKKVEELKNKGSENDPDKLVISKVMNQSDVENLLKQEPGQPESDIKCNFKPNVPCTNPLDLVIMGTSKMTKEKRCKLKLSYIDVAKRCCDSIQLCSWILIDPEVVATIILDITGITTKKRENVPNFGHMTKDKRIDYFVSRFRDMNRMYMLTIPKNLVSVDDWLILLYKLEQLESKLKTALIKVPPPATKPAQTQTHSNISEIREAEILAGKGLSKLISKANSTSKVVKKPEPPKPKLEEKKEPIKEPIKEIKTDLKPEPEKPEERPCKSGALLAKCEAILTSKGEKSLLESFYAIKSYITQGLPVPESYKMQVISICSSIDAKLLQGDVEEKVTKSDVSDKPEDQSKENLDNRPKKLTKCCQVHQEEYDNNQPPTLSCQKPNLMNAIASQNPEILAKYSAQALRNATQTLNAVAFKNLMRNGQSKSESDACDTPKSDCKWTNDCICTSCKNSENGSVCLGDIVKQCYYDVEAKQSKVSLEDKKPQAKEPAKPAPTPAKQPAKVQTKPQKCENGQHQQPHVCKGEFLYI